MTGGAFGYLPDPPDPRDRMLGATKRGADSRRPIVTHNQTTLRRTRYQVGNSCVGASWATILHWSWARDTGADVELSAQHLYALGQLALPGALDAEVQPDGGCYPRDVCRAAQKLGCALERDWPSSALNTGRRVPPAVAAQGLAFAGYDYTRVPLEQGALLDALCDGPVQVGGPWWESWSSPRKHFPVKRPEAGERMEGGHAFVALDYDLTGSVPLVLVLNTWEGWGFELSNPWHADRPLASLCWYELDALLPREYAPHQITDAWTLRAARPRVAP